MSHSEGLYFLLFEIRDIFLVAPESSSPGPPLPIHSYCLPRTSTARPQFPYFVPISISGHGLQISSGLILYSVRRPRFLPSSGLSADRLPSPAVRPSCRRTLPPPPLTVAASGHVLPFSARGMLRNHESNGTAAHALWCALVQCPKMPLKVANWR